MDLPETVLGFKSLITNNLANNLLNNIPLLRVEIYFLYVILLTSKYCRIQINPGTTKTLIQKNNKRVRKEGVFRRYGWLFNSKTSNIINFKRWEVWKQKYLNILNFIYY